jgi:phosphoribosylaminoimidazole-succinocarboxamide synthase
MATAPQETPPAPHEPTPGEEYGAPEENFARGIIHADIPELGQRQSGKVRDYWDFSIGREQRRALLTTDRLSAYDRLICAVPGKGQVLNLLSAWWFDKIEQEGIIPTHKIFVPNHDNVLIARRAVATLPVEVVLRRYIAESSTDTSLCYNYFEKGDREIYGYSFPDGLKVNQELPMGTIITPTTKAETGHDQRLTMREAEQIVDGKFGKGTWKKVGRAALEIYQMSYWHCKHHGLILADTKYEFGIDEHGELMLIDEANTPDSSRFWKADSYQERFDAGQNPEKFDKEIIREWLKEHGFRGEGMVPTVPVELIDAATEAYRKPYEMITGRQLAPPVNDPEKIRSAVVAYIRCEKRANGEQV